MKDKCKKAGHHSYLSAQPKPRWCIWCGAKEAIKEEKVAKKKTPKKPIKKK